MMRLAVSWPLTFDFFLALLHLLDQCLRLPLRLAIVSPRTSCGRFATQLVYEYKFCSSAFIFENRSFASHFTRPTPRLCVAVIYDIPGTLPVRDLRSVVYALCCHL